MTVDEPSMHYVLVGPKGKQAGLRSQKSLAIQLAAFNMVAQGHGGALASLLLPKSDLEFQRLAKLVRKGYWYKLVKVRKTIRQDIRDAAISDYLLLTLATRFELEMKSNKRAMSAVLQHFSIWICSKLSKQDPEITKLVEQAHYDMPNRTSPDWWEKQINQKIK